MSLVRFRVECRGRVELHEVPRPDVEIGREAGCDLAIDHASVAPRHARVLLRRGALILADLGLARTGTTRGQERVLAPITLRPGEAFRLGDVTLSAWPGDERATSAFGTALPFGVVGTELESPDPKVRRYRVLREQQASAEIALLDADVEDGTAQRWCAQVQRSSDPSPSLPAVLGRGEIAGRPYAIEAVVPGMRLAALLGGVARGTLELPIEAAVATLAHLAESVAAMVGGWGPHGAIDPGRVQLGLDGSVMLLRPGPIIGPSAALDDYVAPERRLSPDPSLPGDAFALGVIGKRLLSSRDDCPIRIRAIFYWLAHVDPARRPQDLRALAGELRSAAQTAGLDPTFGHVARVTRLMAPDPGRTMCTVTRDGEAQPPAL